MNTLRRYTIELTDEQRELIRGSIVKTESWVVMENIKKQIFDAIERTEDPENGFYEQLALKHLDSLKDK